MKKNNSCLIQYIISFRTSYEQKKRFVIKSPENFQSTKEKFLLSIQISCKVLNKISNFKIQHAGIYQNVERKLQKGLKKYLQYF